MLNGLITIKIVKFIHCVTSLSPSDKRLRKEKLITGQIKLVITHLWNTAYWSWEGIYSIEMIINFIKHHSSSFCL